ncbi:hypothetical protein [Rubripirellula lacrimiformis]|nr:hypothetical protein [Rubripirellula lacrimiformis]
MLLFLTAIVLAGDTSHFYPNGTDLRLTVDSTTLRKCPKWRPGEGALALSAESAIEVATRFHHSLSFSSVTRFYHWRFAKSTLVSCSGDRWFWVVTYEGSFDETLLGPGSGGHSLECPGTIYNHYPVLWDGSLPKPSRRSPDDPDRPAETVADMVEMLESDGKKFTPMLNTNRWPAINHGSARTSGG